MDAATTRHKLLTRDDLEAKGIGEREVGRRLASGALRRVHVGSYVAAEEWNSAFSEERHLMQVFAVVEAMRGNEAVASHTSSAVLWDLPLFRLSPKRVHLTGAVTSGLVHGDGLIARHRIEVPSTDRALRHGVACTSLSRTVFDVIRGASDETALACADAAFRLVAWHDSSQTYDLDADAAFRAELHERIDRAAGARGIRRARGIVALADGRAHLPGESVSRLYLLQLGFAPPRLQVPIPAPSGRDYLVDFGLDDVSAWGEFDGTGKYTDPALMKDVGYVVLAHEKEREDWIRGTTGRSFARWGMPHVDTAATLGARLAAFGIRPKL